MGKLYDDPSELKEGIVLGQNDVLYIFKMYLSVENCYLRNFEGYGKNNFHIFKHFGIIKPFCFCEKVYGYAPRKNNHDFPEPKPGDYQALTRLIFAFLALSQKKEVVYFKKSASFKSWYQDMAYDHFS